MPKTQVPSEGITDSAITTAKIASCAVSEAKIAGNAVTSAKITDGQVTADDLASSLNLTGKTVTLPQSAFSVVDQNIALLGFKMAVNDGLTVFNLVDGVVDEFHDESGADEGEGSNDTYCSSNDSYSNTSSTPYSAGFGYNYRTESDTSNPATNTYSQGIFTVPTGMTSLNIQAWGAGGGSAPATASSENEVGGGGGGGYAEGTFVVTPGQVLAVAIGQAGYPIHEPNESIAGEGGKGFRGAGDVGCTAALGPADGAGAGGGGASGVATAGPGLPSNEAYPAVTAPEIVLVAGGGGGSGYVSPALDNVCRTAGYGGGLTGGAAGQTGAQTTANGAGGGGGDQEQGGTGGTAVNPPPDGNPGGFLAGGYATQHNNSGGGGEGYYGGGGGGKRSPDAPTDHRVGGGGSSYYGHPQVTSGSTEAGTSNNPGGQTGEGGGVTQPGYVNYSGASDGGAMGDGGRPSDGGEKGGAGNGYVLLTGSGSVTASTTIVSNAFTAGSAPTTSRVVVFQEDVGSVTLNTDIIASISRNGGSNFTNVTLSDSGYVTGASGQRILTGSVDISGQPSGTAMRWKLALANNVSKIHGVSLQWK